MSKSGHSMKVYWRMKSDMKQTAAQRMALTRLDTDRAISQLMWLSQSVEGPVG